MTVCLVGDYERDQDTNDKCMDKCLNDIGINVTKAPYNAKGDGITDDTNSFLLANSVANLLKVPLFLPPGNYLLSQSCTNLISLIGTPNQTTITLTPNFTKTSFNSQFCITNPHFSNGGYNSATADNVVIKHVNIVTTPNQARSIFGFANVASLEMEDVSITANKVINVGTGLPNPVDALIDLYASCKNVEISKCSFNNITCARGTTYPWSSGGGGAIWVRNFVGSATLGAIDANATENIDIHHNYFSHLTSDEAIAVYGVVGKTRRVNIHNNHFYGLDTDQANPVFQPSLISVFPLKNPSLGANALVEDVLIADNYISARSYFYNILRFGSSSDTGVICQRIKSSRNTINSYISTDPTYSPHAQWVAVGSPGGSPDPGSNTQAIRATQVDNTTFTNSNACLESDNDTLICNGSVSWGIAGFDTVNNPTIMGSAYYGLANCINVTGGNIESSSVCFYNCNNVVGPRVRTDVTDTTSCILYVDLITGVFSLKNAYGSTAGGVARLASATTANTRVDVIGNVISMSNSSAYAVNNAGSGVTTARLNDVIGTLAGGTTGSVTTTLNRWGTSTD